jgi:hypothetical protein
MKKNIKKGDHEQMPGQNFRLRYAARGAADAFGAQLPGTFDERLPLPQRTRHIDPLFNDANRQVPERMLPSLRHCHFHVDTDRFTDERAFANAHNSTDTWRLLAEAPFIDLSSSQASGSFLDSLKRAFYVPPYVYKLLSGGTSSGTGAVKFTSFKLRARQY